MDKIPVRKVEFAQDSDREALAKYCKDEFEQAERDRKAGGEDSLYDKWTRAVAQYEGRLPRKWKGATWQADIDIPTTRIKVNAAAARITNPILQQDRIMTAKPRLPKGEPDLSGLGLMDQNGQPRSDYGQILADLAQGTEDFLDFAYDQFDFGEFCKESVRQAAIYSYSVAKIPFTHETRFVKEWVQQPAQQGTDAMGMPVSTPPQWVEVPREQEITFACVPMLVSPEDYFYPSTVSNPQLGPWEAHRFFVDRPEYERRVRDGLYDDVTLSESTPDEAKEQHEKFSGLVPEKKPYELVEMWLSKDIDGDGIDEELVVTFDRQSSTIVRAVYNWFHDYKRPFLLWWWERRHGSVPGVSACYLLEPIHRAISASFCQRLDAATLANSVFPITSDADLAKRFKDKSLKPWEMNEVVGSVRESVEFLSLPQPMNQLPQLEGILGGLADTLMALNQYNYGQEQIQRPTASGQALLVEEGKQPLYEKLDSYRAFLAVLTLIILARYKQFYRGAVPYFKFQDNKLIPMVFNFPPGVMEDKVLIETKASSATMNQQVRKQEAVALMDKMNGEYQTLVQMYGMLVQASQQGSPVAVAVGQAINGMHRLMREWLKAFEVPNADALLPNMDAVQLAQQQYGQVIQQLQQQLMQAQQMIMQLQEQLKNPPVPPPPPEDKTKVTETKNRYDKGGKVVESLVVENERSESVPQPGMGMGGGLQSAPTGFPQA